MPVVTFVCREITVLIALGVSDVLKLHLAGGGPEGRILG